MFENNGFFTAIFRPIPEVQAQAVAQARAQAIEQVTPEVETQSPTQSPTQLSNPVGRLLAILLQKEASSGELREALGIKHRPNFRENYLHPALEAHLIERTIPDKPNSRLQRYRITPRGRDKLNKQRKDP